MLELAGLGFWPTIGILVVIAGVVSYGVTEILKRFMSDYKASHAESPDKAGDRPWWWNSTLRIVAIAAGGGVGFALMPTMIGAGLGVAAGVLNTTIVALAKDKIKEVAGKLVDKVK